MKHAGPEALDQLEPVLAKLRKLDGLRERKRGAFYRGSSAFLHFHEDLAASFEERVHPFRLGIALVFSLMLFATWNDLVSLKVVQLLKHIFA